MDVIVTCIPGLSEALRNELLMLGMSAATAGAATVKIDQCDQQEMLRLCLWSRLAERVLLPVVTVAAGPADAAELLARQFDLDAHLDGDRPLNVHVDHDSGVRGDPRISAGVFIRNLSRRVILQREPQGALCVRLVIGAEHASLSVDMSGVPLSRRGYRTHGGAAPLRESLAAAMLMLAGWPKAGYSLVDPFCGSGTITVEAALMAINHAPGLLRQHFGFLQWKAFQADLWRALCVEAQDQICRTMDVSIKGFDGDDQALRLARANADRAGVSDLIHFERREFGLLVARDFSAKKISGQEASTKGMIVTNPPWGERLEDKPRVEALYQAIGRRTASLAKTWSLQVLGSDVEVLDKLSTKMVSQWRIKNGAITNYLRLSHPIRRAPVTPLQTSEPAFELPEQAQPLANRLRKNGRQLRKWIEREQVQAYRLYDRDLPEFNFSVDIYAERAFVQEFAAPKSIDERAAEQRRAWAISAVRAVLGAHREQVFLRTRAQQKGNRQYQKLDIRKETFTIQEGQAWLLVNLSAYLDTGLFLDHRPFRLQLEQESQGKRFLNLFAYTGAATVQAAVGGAKSSVTVDASHTYLDWAAENLSLNGFSTQQHRLERADVMTWLSGCREQFDIVFCDPPTFSNNKSRDDFVVQRDHAELIRQIMKRVEPGGVLYFSNNFRKFLLDAEIMKWFSVKDITRTSVPPDFSRQQTPHHLFAIRHLEQ